MQLIVNRNHVFSFVTNSVFHLPKNSGNSGWDVNGTRLFGSFHCKFSGVNGIPEKAVPFSRWKLPNGNLCAICIFLVFITSSSILFAAFQTARPPSAPSNGTCEKWNTLFPNGNSQKKFSETFCTCKTPKLSLSYISVTNAS